MGLVSQIAQDARVDVHRTGNMELISGQDLEAFLETARSFGVCILGLEGFRLEGDRVVPDMDAIADFSSIADDPAANEVTIEEARRFASIVGRSDLFYDVFFRDANEE